MKKILILGLTLMLALSNFIFPTAIKATSQFDQANNLSFPFNESITLSDMIKNNNEEDVPGIIYCFNTVEAISLDAKVISAQEMIDIVFELYQLIDGEVVYLSTTDKTMYEEHLNMNLDANATYYLVVAGFSENDKGTLELSIQTGKPVTSLEDLLGQATKIESLPLLETIKLADHSFNYQGTPNCGKTYQVTLQKDETIYIEMNDESNSDFVLELFKYNDDQFLNLMTIDNSDNELYAYQAKENETIYILARAYYGVLDSEATISIKALDKTPIALTTAFDQLQSSNLPYQSNTIDDNYYYVNEEVSKGKIVKFNAEKDTKYIIDLESEMLDHFMLYYKENDQYILINECYNSHLYRAKENQEIYIFVPAILNFNPEKDNISLSINEINHDYVDLFESCETFDLNTNETFTITNSQDHEFYNQDGLLLVGKAYKLKLSDTSSTLFKVLCSSNQESINSGNFNTKFYQLIDENSEESYQEITFDSQSSAITIIDSKSEEIYALIYCDKTLVTESDLTFAVTFEEVAEQTSLLIDHDGTLINSNVDESTFAYDKETASLTLKDGFEMKQGIIDSYVNNLKIVVEGNASINIDYNDLATLMGNDVDFYLKDDAILNLSSFHSVMEVSKLSIHADKHATININGNNDGIVCDEFDIENIDLNINTKNTGISIQNHSNVTTMNHSNIMIETNESGIDCASALEINESTLTISDPMNQCNNGLKVDDTLTVNNSQLNIDTYIAPINIDGSDVHFINSAINLKAKDTGVIHSLTHNNPTFEYHNEEEAIAFYNFNGKIIDIEFDVNVEMQFVFNSFCLNNSIIFKTETISKDRISYYSLNNGSHDIKIDNEFFKNEVCDYENGFCKKCHGSIALKAEIEFKKGVAHSQDTAKSIEKLKNNSMINPNMLYSMFGGMYKQHYAITATSNDKDVELTNVDIALVDETINYNIHNIYFMSNDSLIQLNYTYDPSIHTIFTNVPNVPGTIIVFEHISIVAYMQQALKQLNTFDLSEYTNTSVTALNRISTEINDLINQNEQLEEMQWQELHNELLQAIVDLQIIPFKDIKETDWFYQVVMKAYELSLMGQLKQVDGKSYFGPDVNISRGMVATVLYRMANQPKIEFKATFSDVTNANLWYSIAITWASQNKVVSGYKDGRFGPDDNITRQDLAIMLRNFAASNGLNTNKQADLSTFMDDEQVDSYAVSAIAWCVEQNIMSGSNKKDGKYLNPKANATRAECAKMFSLLYNLINQK